MTDLDISRAWLVDPEAEREGPGEIVVRDGILEAVTWLEGAAAEGVHPTGVVVTPAPEPVAQRLTVRAVPYHRWGSRGPGAMRVWLPVAERP